MAMSLNTGGRSRRGRYRPLAEINVTPLVDVMLVLLIIFMVTAPLMTSGVSVDLPKTSAQPLNSDSAMSSNRCPVADAPRPILSARCKRQPLTARADFRSSPARPA